MHFTLLPVNAPTCQVRHNRSHRLWRPSSFRPSQDVSCQASSSEQQQTGQGLEPQAPTSSADVLPASVKNEQQLDKLLKELADLREQQRLMGLDDEGEMEEDVEGEEGKDWVWWRADQPSMLFDTKTSTPSNDDSKGSNNGSSQQQPNEGQANSAQIQRISPKAGNTSQQPRMMQAKRRVRPDGKLNSSPGSGMKH